MSTFLALKQRGQFGVVVIYRLLCCDSTAPAHLRFNWAACFTGSCVWVHLQSTDDLLQRQGGLRASDEGGGWQPEHLFQVGLIQTVETYMSHDAPKGRKGSRGREGTKRGKEVRKGCRTGQKGGTPKRWTDTQTRPWTNGNMQFMSK